MQLVVYLLLYLAFVCIFGVACRGAIYCDMSPTLLSHLKLILQHTANLCLPVVYLILQKAEEDGLDTRQIVITVILIIVIVLIFFGLFHFCYDWLAGCGDGLQVLLEYRLQDFNLLLDSATL